MVQHLQHCTGGAHLFQSTLHQIAGPIAGLLSDLTKKAKKPLDCAKAGEVVGKAFAHFLESNLSILT